MDSKIIGIDPIYWKILWQSYKGDYDTKQLLYSLGPDQMRCKTWLIDILDLLEIKLKRGYIQLYGGWNGFPLIDMLLEIYDIRRCENIDLDPMALYTYNRYVNLKKLDTDVYIHRNEDAGIPHGRDRDMDLVINTSSEHMPDLPKLIKDKRYRDYCVFALQSNNMTHVDEHINCSESEEHFVKKSGLSEILYSGTEVMSNGYERYMVIGRV